MKDAAIIFGIVLATAAICATVRAQDRHASFEEREQARAELLARIPVSEDVIKRCLTTLRDNMYLGEADSRLKTGRLGDTLAMELMAAGNKAETLRSCAAQAEATQQLRAMRERLEEARLRSTAQCAAKLANLMVTNVPWEELPLGMKTETSQVLLTTFFAASGDLTGRQSAFVMRVCKHGRNLQHMVEMLVRLGSIERLDDLEGARLERAWKYVSGEQTP